MFPPVGLAGPSAFTGINTPEPRTSRLLPLICLVVTLRTQSASSMNLAMYYPLLRPLLQLSTTHPRRIQSDPRCYE